MNQNIDMDYEGSESCESPDVDMEDDGSGSIESWDTEPVEVLIRKVTREWAFLAEQEGC